MFNIIFYIFFLFVSFSFPAELADIFLGYQGNSIYLDQNWQGVRVKSYY